MSAPRDPAPHAGPDTEPETLLDPAAETQPGHAALPEPTRTIPAVSAPSSPKPARDDVESMTRVTKGGTQISSWAADDAHTTLDSTDRALSLGSTREVERPPSSAVIDERFREIERRLDRMDARMRLLEKGAEQGSNGRAALVWWMAALVGVVVWALLSRLR